VRVIIINIITVYSSDHVDPLNRIRTITKEKKEERKNRTVIWSRIKYRTAKPLYRVI